MRASAGDPRLGDRVDTMSDAEMMDSLDYTLFPNFHPWGAFNRIVYRFRPNGDDHRSSIMEVFFLLAVRWRAAPARERCTPRRPTNRGRTLPSSGCSPRCSSRTRSTWHVQLGLETTFKPGITLGNYQESKVRWLNHKIDQWLARP